MKTALYLNGVYESVLEEIITSQNKHDTAVNFLQPHKGQIIQMLKKSPPSKSKPTSLYISTTKSLRNICYTGEIIGWSDKREISDTRKNQILAHLVNYQKEEVSLFTATDKIGESAVNLLELQNLRECETLLSTSVLKKKSNGLPLKPRTRSGGWSEVFNIGEVLLLPTFPKRDYNSELQNDLKDSENSSAVERKNRLATSSPFPEKIQVLSSGFRRNSDVIVEVLNRANGICELCKKPAPFKRKSNGIPFLEVHHWTPLSEGGKDTVKNAGALCPNCHREVHYG